MSNNWRLEKQDSCSIKVEKGQRKEEYLKRERKRRQYRRNSDLTKRERSLAASSGGCSTSVSSDSLIS
ncbi:hypothetical protein SLA2020_153830 [Shorea laevis]